jgi:16S rRNA (adenine1518-N6/adenine1519-N6)-dimethyltransferase
VLASAEAATHVRVAVADALSVDLTELLGVRPDRDDPPGAQNDWSSVSNLPYNVAVPVVMRLLEEATRVRRLLVMVQREVGERLAAAPGDAQYGAVSVKVSYFAEAKVVGVVPPTVFIPRPNVESVLVRMRRRASPPVSVPSPDELFTLVRTGFAQRRKMLRRSLRPLLGERTSSVLDRAGVAPTARAEELGLVEWAALSRCVAAAG